MYIKKIRGWNDVGYVEESIKVPFNILKKEESDWEESDIHTSPERLFSSIEFGYVDEGSVYPKLMNLKYLEILYDFSEQLYYGWVDSVRVVTNNLIELNWHVDYWRTFIRDCVIDGWVIRRGANGNDPPQSIPSVTTISPAEEIELANQLRGIGWVFLSYMTSDGLVSAAAQAGLSLIPGSQYLQRAGLNTIGIVRMFSNAVSSWFSSENSDVPVKNAISSKSGFGNDYFVSCVYPVSVRPNLNVKIGAAGSDTTVIAPSLHETIVGLASFTLGIEAGRLLGTFISPVCPVLYSSGSGYEKDPLKFKIVDRILNLEFDVNSVDYISGYKLVGECCWLTLVDGGARNVGRVDEGCPELPDVLLNYHWSNKILDPIVIGDTKVVIKPSNLQTVNYGKTFTLMPLKIWLRNAHVEWRRVTRILTTGWQEKVSDHWEQYIFRRQGGDIKWTKNRKDDGYEWVLMHNCIFYPVGTPLQHPDDMYEVKELDYTSGGVVAKYVDEDDPDIYSNQIFEFDELYISTHIKILVVECYDPSENYAFVNTASAMNINVRRVIQSKTSLWPILEGDLGREYTSDDTHDLILVGPSGEPVFRFKHGFKARKYTYQTVCIGSTCYIKYRFESTHPLLSDAEVHVPIGPSLATLPYTNPYTGVMQAIQQTEATKLELAKVKEQNNQNIIFKGIKGLVGTMAGLAFHDKDMVINSLSKEGFDTVLEYTGMKSNEEREEKYKNKMRQVNDTYQQPQSTSTVFTGDMSWLHEYGTVRLVYVTKDDYSVTNYYNSVSKIGIEVNEYTDNIENLLTKGGPLQLGECSVTGSKIPREAITYISGRLRGGVLVDLNL